MIKIGIITFHRAINYGALFQTYALQQSLKNEGADVEVIDYRSPGIEHDYRLTWGLYKRKIKGWIKWFISVPYKIRKKRKFRKYESQVLNLSPRHYNKNNISEVESRFDKIVTGSDQVWNMWISKNETAYFLDFVNDTKKKYSYAVSVGNYKFEEEDTAIALLKDFTVRSLREESDQAYIEELIHDECQINVDPTLLFSGKDWEKEISVNSKMKMPYIFLYTVHPQRNLVEYAKCLSEKTGYPIYYLHNRENMSLLKLKGVHAMFSCSPEEFLGFIHNAEYVMTNSFHGTVFSILFEKQFLSEVVTIQGFNNRVFNLLHSLGLERRILENNTELNAGIDIDEVINWNLVSEKLSDMRKNSLDYIKNLAQK